MSNPIEKWYAFYPSDYKRSTKFFSDEADLLYRRMLDLYWETLGKLPANNDKVIAKELGYNARKFARVWSEVSPKFPVKNGKLTNPRMDHEIEKALKKHRSAVINGKKGGRPKKNPEVNSSLSQSKALNGGGGGPIQDGNYSHSNNTDTDTQWGDF